MPLVDSLLTAIVRSDGDALVLHVGEKPYVVAATGSVELSRQGLGLGAMEGLLAQLLNADSLRGLRELGAVEHELDDSPASAGDRFTVVAARGGDDIWIEVRRHRRVREAVVVPPTVVAPVVDAPLVESADMAPPTAEAVPEPAALGSAPIVVTDLPVVEELTVSQAPVHEEAHVEAPHVEEPPAEVPYHEQAHLEPTHAEEPHVEEPHVEEPLVAAPHLEVPFLDETRDTETHVAGAHLDAPGHVALAQESDATAPPDGVVAAEVATFAGIPVEGLLPPELEFVGESVPMPTFAPISRRDADAAAVEAAIVEAAIVEAAIIEAAIIEATPPEPVVESRGVVAARAVARLARNLLTPAAVKPPPVVRAPEMAAAPAAPVPFIPAAPELAASRNLEPPAAPSSRPTVHPKVPAAEQLYVPEPQPTPPGPATGPFGVESRLEQGRGEDEQDTLPGVVLSLTRDATRTGGSSVRGGVRPGGIERLLRVAAARGASALYLTTQARPAVRVDGDIRLLEGETALSSGDVEAAVLELAPDGARDKESAEWTRDLQDIGRVRITTFRDYRGPGALLRMISARATSAEQLGLVREIQALATEPEGLVIVTGPRASGKSTLVSAFVDLINRQRNDYVITLEGQIRLVHESRESLISQRELRGSAAEVVAAARAALRENPDVMVIEDLRSPDVLQVALDAAGSGLLVFVSVTAASATAALERLVDLCPSDQRRTVRAALAEHLRGVVAQVLLRKAGGGRLAARELVLNTNAVAALVSDGQIAQLPRAIDSGRKLGMAPLNDALVAFVQSGAVDVREAYRKADDKAGLLALLRREGIDTSFVERLA